MKDKDSILLFETYRESVALKKNSFIDDIYSQLEKGLNQWGLFSSSEVVKYLITNYSDSVEYRSDKKFTQEQRIKKDLEERFLKKVKDIPFDIKNISLSLSLDVKQKDNFLVGGFFDPKGESNEFRINLKLNNVIKDKESFKQELYYIAVHELIHARQVYGKRLRNEVIIIPEHSPVVEKFFKLYLMNEDELEAYATEYNYRNNNDPSKIEDFARHIITSSGFDIETEEVRNLFKDYLTSLYNAVKKYPWKGF